MSDDPKQLPAPEGGRSDWLLQVLVLLIAFALLLVLLLATNPGTSGLTLADKTIGVAFVEPADGQAVESPFVVQFDATGLIVEPAGEINEGAGHFHVLIDEDFVAAGEIIPNDETHRHYGDGSTETELDLPPGTYTLRLQFANGAHQTLEGDEYRDEISVTVLEGE